MNDINMNALIEGVKKLYTKHEAELTAAAEYYGLPTLTLGLEEPTAEFEDRGMWYMPTNEAFFEDAVPALQNLHPVEKTGLKALYYAIRNKEDLAERGFKLSRRTVYEQLTEAVEYALRK